MLPIILALGILATALHAPVEPSSVVRDGVVHPTENPGLWGRLAAGNIDQAGSPAYNRWGDGYVQGLGSSDRKFTRARE